MNKFKSGDIIHLRVGITVLVVTDEGGRGIKGVLLTTNSLASEYMLKMKPEIVLLSEHDLSRAQFLLKSNELLFILQNIAERNIKDE